LSVPRIRAAAMHDATMLASRLRAADIEEIRAAAGLTPLTAIERSLALSTHAWTAVDGHGAPLAIWGVGPLSAIAGRGCPWLLASEAFEVLPRASVARLSLAWLARVNTLYPRLENHVDARHVKAVRWLAWLGFTIESPLPWGVERRPFHRFWRDNEKGPAHWRKRSRPFREGGFRRVGAGEPLGKRGEALV
jgi:hypothetical protein